MRPKVYLYRFKKYDTWRLGLLMFKSKHWFTAELLWKNNIVDISCYPDGEYEMILQRHYTSAGTSYPAWEVIVDGRTDIELHFGNKPIKDSKGCTLVGDEYDNNGIKSGTSKPGFERFMNATRMYMKLKLVVKTIDYREPTIKRRKNLIKEAELQHIAKDFKLPELKRLKIGLVTRIKLFMRNRWKGFTGGALLIGAHFATGFLGTGLGIIGTTLVGGEVTHQVGKSTKKYGKKGEFDIEELFDLLKDLFKFFFRKEK